MHQLQPNLEYLKPFVEGYQPFSSSFFDISAILVWLLTFLAIFVLSLQIIIIITIIDTLIPTRTDGANVARPARVGVPADSGPGTPTGGEGGHRADCKGRWG